jgi:histidyl-tRNA synthetase
MDKLQAPRGTHDVLPAQEDARRGLEKIAARILGAAGYARIETPTFEATDLFKRTVGESTDIVQKEMYTFDDGGGRSMTLRPEVTAPIARAYLEHGMHKLPQPVKLWYVSSCFRYERAQAGRQRQFWQIGAEAIGAVDPAVDAELITLLHGLLGEAGVQGLALRISSLGTPATRAAYRARLQEFLRENAQHLSEEVVSRIELNPMRAFDADHPGTVEVMKRAPLLLDELDPEDAEHFDEVRALLEVGDVAYTIDPTLVRGLDYYARTVFEFTSDALGAQSAVGGGGRYDGLVEQLGGPSTPGCGWAAGVERIFLAAGERAAPTPQVDLYVAFEGEAQRAAAFAIATHARRAGRYAQMELARRSIKGQLKHADRIGARFVAILREDGTVLRDADSGAEHAVDPAADAVVAAVQRGMGSL